MGIADASYKFIYIDVGTNGRVSDGGVFRRTAFYDALQNNSLHLPQPVPLPERSKCMPFVLVADDAFSASTNLLKPFNKNRLDGIQRIFNYRLSRARRVVENAFGILSARFCIFRSPIQLNPEKARKITTACCALHNFLMMRNATTYLTSSLVDRDNADGSITPGEWRNDAIDSSLHPLPRQRSNNSERIDEIKNEFSQYFINQGEIPFQYQQI